MITLPQAPYTAVQILEEAVKQATPGKIVKLFRNGEILVEYDCTWITATGTSFQSNMRIRAREELQCL